MNSPLPLVTIGIPAFNRAAMLRRSLDSVVNQDYHNIQIIVSDNASIDETEVVCKDYELADRRIFYVKQATNIGAVGNFMEVLKRAKGEYFMWLGDDDWIDSSYIGRCVSVLMSDQGVSLVSGEPIYYRSGIFSFRGKVFDLLSNNWFFRVFFYYARVADNGMFYGVFRTSNLNNIKLENVLGGDWHLVAKLAALGKTKMLSTTLVHRELGGASASYSKIIRSAGLPGFQFIFPMLTIGYGAYKNFVLSEVGGDGSNSYLKYFLGAVIFVVVFVKPIISIPWRVRLRFQRV